MEPALYNIDRKYDCVIEPENEVREVLEILGSGIQTTGENFLSQLFHESCSCDWTFLFATLFFLPFHCISF